eukprot:1150904-Pelagomonas_calceolata.AAC.3
MEPCNPGTTLACHDALKLACVVKRVHMHKCYKCVCVCVCRRASMSPGSPAPPTQATSGRSLAFIHAHRHATVACVNMLKYHMCVCRRASMSPGSPVPPTQATSGRSPAALRRSQMRWRQACSAACSPTHPVLPLFSSPLTAGSPQRQPLGADGRTAC